MLSRIADSLFWLNRYIERSDTVLRLVYVHYILSLDRSDNTNNNWKSVLELCTTAGAEEISRVQNNTTAALRLILLDDNNANSICNMVSHARENARGAQDHLTKEVWAVINQMYHQANETNLPARLQKNQALKIIESFSQSTVLFAGVTDNTMWRGLGWNFMQLGKFIERCHQTITIMQKQLTDFGSGENDTNDILQWRHLLLSLSGYEMHLKTYRTQDYTQNALHQIILDENFTRSIIYSLIRIHHYMENIMIIHEDQNKDLVRNFGRLHSKVRYMDLRTMNRSSLWRFLHEVNADLFAFSGLLSNYYFSYS
jgi:uncharacterized alpha-E superfamily protein